jgi:hypothetical protein
MSGELVEADSDGLAQVHRGLEGVCGDLDQDVAPGEVFACKSMFFRAEDQGHAAAADQFLTDQRGQLGERDDGLLGLAIGEGTGADNEGAVGDCLGKSC